MKANLWSVMLMGFALFSLTHEVQSQIRRDKTNNLSTKDVNVLPCALELAFLLDSSESAMLYGFEKEKGFVRSFAQRMVKMQVPGWALTHRLAVLQYSSSAFIMQRFSEWDGLEKFLNSVGNMRYIGQGTYTAYAIRNATELFVQETDVKSVRVMLLMTDGSDHPRSPNSLNASDEAKAHNITLFTISLSSQGSHKAKLGAMASAPMQRFVHNLNDQRLEQKLLKKLLLIIRQHNRRYLCIGGL